MNVQTTAIQKSKLHCNLAKKSCLIIPRKLPWLSRSPSELDSLLPPKRYGYVFRRDCLLRRQATHRGRLCGSCRSYCSLADPSQRITQEGRQLLCQSKTAALHLGTCRPNLVDCKLRFLHTTIYTSLERGMKTSMQVPILSS